jgi:hypothetical protein
MQRLLQDIGGKRTRSHAGEVPGEGQHQQRVDPGSCQQLHLLCQRRNQRLLCLWAQNSPWVRIEGDGHRTDAEATGTFDHFSDHAAMPAMHAIEVADRGDRRAEANGNLREVSIDLHQAISKEICRPS